MEVRMAISADLYRTFFGVGLYLSFSRAAKEIGVSQSAISQSIKQLEAELNIPLFVRTTKSVAFTPEGKELFDTVAKAFSILDNGVTQLQERVAQDFATLNLAATDTLCRHYLLPYFRKWESQVSDIGLNIINRPSPSCVEPAMRTTAWICGGIPRWPGWFCWRRRTTMRRRAAISASASRPKWPGRGKWSP